MENSLKCVVCMEYANEAVESKCNCTLLYCEKCAKKTNLCKVSQCKLSYYKCDPSKEIYGFEPNKLARRMIGSIPVVCDV